MGAAWSKIAIATLAAATMLLAAAPVASADHTARFHAFSLQGSNGYRVDVWAVEDEPAEDGGVVIFVTGKRGSAAYLAPATVTKTRIDADLGELGRIALELVPTGGEDVARLPCDPDEQIHYDKSQYVGEFELRGEEGYTTVRASRIAYRPQTIIGLLCGTSISGEVFGHGVRGARLTAHARLGRGRVSLQVNQNRPGAPVRVRSSIVERRGRIVISREVGGTDRGGAFEFASDLRFAATRPDAPFSGTGTFRRGTDPANRWTGNLEVDFPGRSNVPLTGKRFHAKLIHARLTEEKVREGGPDRPNLRSWLSTKPSPSAFGTFSPLALK